MINYTHDRQKGDKKRRRVQTATPRHRIPDRLHSTQHRVIIPVPQPVRVASEAVPDSEKAESTTQLFLHVHAGDDTLYMISCSLLDTADAYDFFFAHRGFSRSTESR